MLPMVMTVTFVFMVLLGRVFFFPSSYGVVGTSAHAVVTTTKTRGENEVTCFASLVYSCHSNKHSIETKKSIAYIFD